MSPSNTKFCRHQYTYFLFGCDEEQRFELDLAYKKAELGMLTIQVI
jgi:hypothetical protein